MRLVVAMLARLRSLLIMIGDDRTPRSRRTMLKWPFLRDCLGSQARIALITVSTASSEASTLSRLIDDWKSIDDNARSSCSWAAYASRLAGMMGRSLASVILAALKW